MCTDIYLQFYYVHWHLQQCLIQSNSWLIRTPYLSIIDTDVTNLGFRFWTDWFFVLWFYFLCYEFYDKFDLLSPSILDNFIEVKSSVVPMWIKRRSKALILMEGEYDLTTVLFCLCDEQSNITYCLLVQRTNKQEVKRQDALLMILLPWGLLCCVSHNTSSGQLFTVFVTTHNNGKLFKDQSFVKTFYC